MIATSQFFSVLGLEILTTVFTVEKFVDVPLCTLIPLVEIYGHLIPCTLVLAVETQVLRVEISVHMITQSSLLVLLCVCLSVILLLQSSMHVLPQSSVLAVAVPCICLYFCPEIMGIYININIFECVYVVSFHRVKFHLRRRYICNTYKTNLWSSTHVGDS